MEEFLNSEVFEKMSKAYQERYGSVNVLESNDIKVEKLRPILSDIHKLLAMLDTEARGKSFFLEYFDKRDELKNFLQSIENELSINIDKDFENNLGAVNNKTCINLLSSLIKRLFYLHNEHNFERVEKILNLLLDAIMAFYSGF